MATTETIRDMGAQMAKWEHERRQAELLGGLGAELNPDNNTPFQDQNTFLANEVKKIGEASAERARLTSEFAKEEYDNQVRGNILKAKELAENRQQEADLATAQNAQQNIQTAQAILQQLNSINLEPYRGKTMHNMPNDVLARLTQLGQEWNNLRESAPDMNLPPYDPSFLETGIGIPTVPQEQAIAPANQQHPATFENGRYSDFKTNQDGSVEIKISTGETFKAGNVEELFEKVSKSKVDTSRWAKEQKAKLEQVVNTGNGYEARFSNGERYLGNTPDEVMNNIARSEAERSANGMPYSSISDWYINENADKITGAISKRLGFDSTDEMVQHLKGLAQTGQTIEEQALAASFHARHPEYPDTDQASEAMGAIIAQNRWEWNMDSMEAAHALALQRGMYQPLTQQQIAIANGTAPIQHQRPTPPPLVRGSNPEQHTQQLNEWSMSLQDLRQKAIQQQLGEGR